MLFHKINIFIELLVLFVLAACDGDSGNNASRGNPKSRVSATFTYKTYEGLVAERPCCQSLNMVSAYVSSTNEEYLCCYDATLEQWSWLVNLDGLCLDLEKNEYQISSSSVRSRSSSSVVSSSSFSILGGDFFIDSRDGQAYRVVTIGSQIWMAQNLNYDDGVGLCYDNSNEKCALYGRLYGLNTEICPAGWHLPTIYEWNALFDYVGGKSVAGEKLKSELGWNDFGNGLNEYNFSILPAGSYNRVSNLEFGGEGASASFWCAPVEANAIDSIYYEGIVYLRLFLSSSKDDISVSWYTALDVSYAAYKFSIRCLKDVSAENVSIASSSSSSLDSRSSSSSSNLVLTDSRDGLSYRVVKIGKQVWMAQNLNFETEGSFCYKDDEENCTKYGRLYTWAAAMDGEGLFSGDAVGCGNHKKCSPTYPVQGVCPMGWHLPQNDEWEVLLKYVGNDNATTVLKSKSGWDGNGDRTDKYGFSALPAGGKVDRGAYLGVGNDAHFWSSSELYGNTADALNLHSVAIVIGDNKEFGYSVRCVMD